jgi:hypothetical protein
MHAKAQVKIELHMTWVRFFLPNPLPCLATTVPSITLKTRRAAEDRRLPLGRTHRARSRPANVRPRVRPVVPASDDFKRAAQALVHTRSPSGAQGECKRGGALMWCR